MKSLLYISASLFGDSGHSTRLANRFVENLLAQRQGSQHQGSLVRRNLADEPIPHIDAERFSAFTTPAQERNAAQQAVAALSDQLINEWRESDLVVIGLPMYNLGIPSTLKSYIDHIARAGETFRYTENGPVGLLQDRKVYVIATRGGQYQGTPLDTQTEYVRHIFGLMGITDIEFIYAEGLNMGEAVAEPALQQAQGKLTELARLTRTDAA